MFNIDAMVESWTDILHDAAFDTREPYPLRCDNCNCELFDNNWVETPQNFYCDEHCQEEDFEKRLSLAERSINPKIWAKI